MVCALEGHVRASSQYGRPPCLGSGKTTFFTPFSSESSLDVCMKVVGMDVIFPMALV